MTSRQRTRRPAWASGPARIPARITALILACCVVTAAGCGSRMHTYAAPAPQWAGVGRVAVIPFANGTSAPQASSVVTGAFIAGLVRTGRFRVEFQGTVRSFFIRERLVVRQGVDLKTLAKMRERLGLDAVVLGLVEEYAGSEEIRRAVVPRATVSVRMVDTATGAHPVHGPPASHGRGLRHGVGHGPGTHGRGPEPPHGGRDRGTHAARGRTGPGGEGGQGMKTARGTNAAGSVDLVADLVAGMAAALVAALISLGPLWLVLACPVPAMGGDTVLAMVNGDPVTQDEVRSRIAGIHRFAPKVRAEGGALSVDVRGIVSALVERRLLVQEARRLGLDRHPEILAELDRFRRARAVLGFRKAEVLDNAVVHDDAVQERFEEHHGGDGGLDEEQQRRVLRRIRKTMEREAVARLTGQVEQRLREGADIRVDEAWLEAMSPEGVLDGGMEEPGHVVVEVDGQALTVADVADELRRSLRLRSGMFRRAHGDDQVRGLLETLKGDAVDRLVVCLLVESEAMSRGFGDTDEVREALAEHEQALLAALMERDIIAPLAEPDEGRLRAYHAAHAREFTAGSQVRLSRMRFRDPDHARRVLGRDTPGRGLRIHGPGGVPGRGRPRGSVLGGRGVVAPGPSSGPGGPAPRRRHGRGPFRPPVRGGQAQGAQGRRTPALRTGQGTGRPGGVPSAFRPGARGVSGQAQGHGRRPPGRGGPGGSGGFVLDRTGSRASNRRGGTMSPTARLLSLVCLAVSLAVAGAACRKEPVNRFRKQTCLDCHDERLQGFKAVGKMHDPVARGRCDACHKPHGVMGGIYLKASGKGLCADCHAGHGGLDASASGHAPVDQGRCLDCHDPHATGRDALLKDDDGCLGCHDGEPFQRASVHKPLVGDGCVRAATTPTARAVRTCSSVQWRKAACPATMRARAVSANATTACARTVRAARAATRPIPRTVRPCCAPRCTSPSAGAGAGPVTRRRARTARPWPGAPWTRMQWHRSAWAAMPTWTGPWAAPCPTIRPGPVAVWTATTPTPRTTPARP